MLSLLSAILCLLFFASAVEVAIGGYAPLPTPLIVETRTGRVLGTTLTSRSGRKFAAFLGIPYARPPIGTRRFQAPEPMYLWDEVFNATKYGPICPQLDFPQPDPTKFPPPPKDKKGTGDEDCLKLNVFSNGYLNNDYQQENELLPVLVFIHGGFFMSGSGGYYGPRYLMDHDIILVTFNYRLGPFGFLSTEDLHAPGNAGMKDQVLVLKWIQRNIKSFGGDPARVTIYGQSAGSVSVQLHMLTPASEGLFSAGISSSGAAYKVYSHQLYPLQQAELVGEEVGCGNYDGDIEGLNSCLLSIKASVLAANTDGLLGLIKRPLRMFGPSTERFGTSATPFSLMDPYPAMIRGAQRRVPWMVGMNSGEGFLATNNIHRDDNLTQWVNSGWLTELGPQFLIYDQSLTNRTEALSKFYLSTYRDEGVIDIRKDFAEFTSIFSDRMYIHALITAVKFQSQLSPVFLYYNDYRTGINEFKFGTTHGEELVLLFSPSDLNAPLIEEGHPDYEQSKLIVELFVQFVTNPYNVTFKNRRWDPVVASKTEYGVEHEMNCFLFKNGNGEDGEQGVGKFPKSVEDRLAIWSQLGIPPYQEKTPES